MKRIFRELRVSHTGVVYKGLLEFDSVPCVDFKRIL